jgi:protein-S-isoprenylcysteine O-methyltransferase Ste14
MWSLMARHSPEGLGFVWEQKVLEQGNWLFRWRSFVPAALVLPIAMALADFHYPAGDHALQHAWAFGCLLLSLCGLAIRVLSIGCAPGGTSGRNTRRQKAACLNTTGLYSVTRNPLYLGNFIIWLGIVAVLRSPLLALCFVFAFALYYERIIAAEERFLFARFGETYREWAERTPLFFPRLSLWRPAARAFSLRAVLRREYSAVFGIAAAFFLLDVAEHVAADRALYVDPSWTILLVLGGVTYMLLRMLKKHTSVLKRRREPVST